MTKKYFKDCKTAEDVKKEYRRLAMELHPDNAKTGDAEAFKEMSIQYEKAFDRLKNIHVNEAGEKYEKETNETPEIFKDIIDKIIFFDGCTVEIIGAWVWVSGNTYAYKDALKDAGFRFSGNKVAWYWHFGEYHKRGKKKYSLQDIRNKYGAQEVELEKEKRLATA